MSYNLESLTQSKHFVNIQFVNAAEMWIRQYFLSSKFPVVWYVIHASLQGGTYRIEITSAPYFCSQQKVPICGSM